MSVFGLCTYLLNSSQGRAYMPFVRGSCFMLKYEASMFHKYHVVTAGHIALPHKYPHMYVPPEILVGKEQVSWFSQRPPGSYDPKEHDPRNRAASSSGEDTTKGEDAYAVDGRPTTEGIARALRCVRDRFLSWRALHHCSSGRRCGTLDLALKVHKSPTQDVAFLRVDNEQDALAMFQSQTQESEAPLPSIEPFDLDTGVINRNEELLFIGHNCLYDDKQAENFALFPTKVDVTCVGHYNSSLYGQVLLCDTQGAHIPTAMAGGPVVRKSTGGCVGVIVGHLHAGQQDEEGKAQGERADDGSGEAAANDKPESPQPKYSGTHVHDEAVDSRGVEVDIDLKKATPEVNRVVRYGGAAFVPARAFVKTMRRCETA